MILVLIWKFGNFFMKNHQSYQLNVKSVQDMFFENNAQK